MLHLKTAAELTNPALERRWHARREGRDADVLRAILSSFVATGGPVLMAAVAAAFPERSAAAVAETVRALDAVDLLQLDGERIVVAYPFCAAPTPFRVRLTAGTERYACCAIDALGVAPMLGEPVRVISECHHCHEPLAFAVGTEGPGPDGAGVMAWVETWREGERRIATSL
jgi:alkylmercury lyase-like protein